MGLPKVQVNEQGDEGSRKRFAQSFLYVGKMIDVGGRWSRPARPLLTPNGDVPGFLVALPLETRLY